MPLNNKRVLSWFINLVLELVKFCFNYYSKRRSGTIFWNAFYFLGSD